MTKVRCGRYGCQHCFGEYCELEIITITAKDGCTSYRGPLGATDFTPHTWSTNPWDNYDKQSQSEDLMEQQRKRMRLLREDKISKDDVN